MKSEGQRFNGGTTVLSVGTLILHTLQLELCICEDICWNERHPHPLL